MIIITTTTTTTTPREGFCRDNETKIIQVNITALRAPTGRRQTNWLCTGLTKELNSGSPRTTPATDQSGT